MVHRFPEEAGTRHSCHADLPDHPLAEFQICPSLKLRQSEKFRNVDHHKIGPLRHIVLQAHTVQPGKKVVALFCVKGLQVFVVACRQFQTGHSGFLQRCSRTHRKEIVHLAGTLDHLCRADEIAQTPACNGVGLGERVAGDGMFKHAGQACHADMLCRSVDDMLVHLICYHKGIVLDCKGGNGLQLVPAEHLAARVGGVAQDQCLGSLGKALFDQRDIKLIGGRHQRDIDRLRTRKDGVCAIVLVERRKDHHLVAGVADGHHGRHHGLGAAAGHADLGVGVHSVVQGGAGLFGQRLAEVLCTKGHSVLVRAGIGCPCQRVQQLLRRVKIRKTLRQVDGVILIIDAGHAADDRIRKGAHTVT